MRKLSIAGLALVAVLSVASVAFAANVYTVGGAAPARGKGSTTKPIPTAIKLSFRVTSEDPSQRGDVVKKFSLGLEGLRTNPGFFPSCAFTDLDNPTVPKKCGKAQVGTGFVKNAAGAADHKSLADSAGCNLEVRLYNTGKGMAVRVDAAQKSVPIDSDQTGCALPIHTAINGKFVKRRIGGVTSSDFTFDVPQNLKHPLPGIDNTLRSADVSVRLKSKLVRGKRRGFYEKTGCKGKTRQVRGIFVTEESQSQPSQTFKDTATKKC
jgi:hypothetical protein